MANDNSNETPTSAQAQPRGVHLVGSVPLNNAEEVFRTASSTLGDRLRRVPDGETGVRTNWIGWQINFLAQNPHLEVLPPDPIAYAPLPSIRLRSPASPEDITFDQLGYAGAAIASYAVFTQLKQAGIIPAHYRFQVSLPTPLAPVVAFVAPEDRAIVEPAYEKAMFAELDRITAAIPRDELAIQWDVAVEFGILENIRFTGSPWLKQRIIERLTQLGDHVQADVELGYHICYGDAGDKRTINWIHMPVPRNRTDDAYFAPLRDLQLHPETELYLGLVHFTDGVEGTRQRIAAAQRVVTNFGVATECGFGRRPPETIPDLLRIHSAVAAPVSP